MMNEYDSEYLAHSKGPWKKHKYIKKVGNRYYYAGSKGYYKALANDPNAKYNSSLSQRKAAQRYLDYKAQKSQTAKNKRRAAIKNAPANAKHAVKRAAYVTGLAARGTAVRTAKGAADLADRLTNKSRRTATVRLAKRAAGKAAVNAAAKAVVAGRKVSRKANHLKRIATRKSYVASRKVLNSARLAKKKGREAISNLMTKYRKNKVDRINKGNLKRASKKYKTQQKQAAKLKRKNDKTWAGNLKRARKKARKG